MTDLQPYENGNLPASIDDLAKFVLIGREKLVAVRAGIRAMEKIDVAEGVRQQKRDEAQMLAEALLDAETRIGEILKKLPKASGGDRKSVDFKMDTSVYFENTSKPPKETKKAAIERVGFSQKQAQRFETLADNKDLVEEVKQRAIEDDDLATRSEVLRLARQRKVFEDIERQKQEINNSPLNVPSGLFDVVVLDPP